MSKLLPEDQRTDCTRCHKRFFFDDEQMTHRCPPRWSVIIADLAIWWKEPTDALSADYWSRLTQEQWDELEWQSVFAESAEKAAERAVFQYCCDGSITGSYTVFVLTEDRAGLTRFRVEAALVLDACAAEPTAVMLPDSLEL